MIPSRLHIWVLKLGEMQIHYFSAVTIRIKASSTTTAQNSTQHPNIEGQNRPNFIVSLKTDNGHHRRVRHHANNILYEENTVEGCLMYRYLTYTLINRLHLNLLSTNMVSISSSSFWFCQNTLKDLASLKKISSNFMSGLLLGPFCTKNHGFLNYTSSNIICCTKASKILISG